MATFKESFPEKQKRAKKVVELLSKTYPDAHCALDHQNAFQLLVATILSAQCTDERVNKVTPDLFKKFPTPRDFVKAKVEDIEEAIRSTGFYKNKAKNIKACAEQLVTNHKGQVPNTMDELHALPGVGRKTANVVLGNIFDVPSMVVDTHVTRLSNRLGFVKGTDAVKIELELQKIIEEKDWTMFSHYLITHGRTICKARKPECKICFLNKHCPQLPYKK
jgi:endonuclease-3